MLFVKIQYTTYLPVCTTGKDGITLFTPQVIKFVSLFVFFESEIKI